MILPIACAIDNNYTLPLLVMLTSLRDRLGSCYSPILFLLHQGLSEDALAVISRLIETRSIVPPAESAGLIPKHPHFPPEAAYPLLLSELLPGTVERILVLDADLLVLDDVAKLWEIDLGSRVLAAVQDAAIPLCSSPRGVKSERGITDTSPYFNAGVMLVQLAGWRDRNVSRRALDYLRKVGTQVDFLHQEALNAVLWEDWLPLETRWNLLASLTGRRYGQSSVEDCQNPGIVHFAGRFKPWRAPIGGPFNARYKAFLSQAIQWVPAVRPTFRDSLLSFYDRHLRNTFYGCERALWERRLL